ncbi:FAD-binding oxidoreductase [Thermodesulfobacteriota bacterium]
MLCETTLRLLPLPERMETLLLSFESFEAACTMVDEIFKTSLLPVAVELLNGDIISTLEPLQKDFLPKDFIVAVGLEAFEEAVSRMNDEILTIASDCKNKTNTVLSQEAHQNFWLSLGDVQTVLTGKFSGLITLKLSYPVSEWKTIIPFAADVLSSKKLNHTIQCHAGSGICMIHLLLDKHARQTAERANVAVNTLLERTSKANGNLIVMDAPSETKSKLPIWGAPRDDVMIMTRIKKQLDPGNIMIPGRFVGKL